MGTTGDPHDGWNGNQVRMVVVGGSNYVIENCAILQQSMNRPANRLRMRKGRSVVHKNLEDNYGAVVVANHEALAQVLEQVIRLLIVLY